MNGSSPGGGPGGHGMHNMRMSHDIFEQFFGGGNPFADIESMFGGGMFGGG